MRSSIARLVWALPLALVACGPSEGDVDQAVRAALAKSVPGTLAGNLTGGTAADIDGVKVLSIGPVQTNPRTDGKYWRVKVHARGICQVMLAGGDKEFDGNAEFDVSKTSTGTWAARPVGW
jgi:hypothetical protein